MSLFMTTRRRQQVSTTSANRQQGKEGRKVQTIIDKGRCATKEGTMFTSKFYKTRRVFTTATIFPSSSLSLKIFPIVDLIILSKNFSSSTSEAYHIVDLKKTYLIVENTHSLIHTVIIAIMDNPRFRGLDDRLDRGNRNAPRPPKSRRPLLRNRSFSDVQPSPPKPIRPPALDDPYISRVTAESYGWSQNRGFPLDSREL